MALAGPGVAAVFAQAPAPQAPAPQAAPAAEPPYRFSGLVFGDYYGFSRSHDPAWEGQQGFWFRRIFFTFDYHFSPKLTTRLRLEMNSNGKLGGGVLTPYVRDAYLRWVFRGRQQFTLGLQPTASIEYVDAHWGLRHVEKTPVDFYKWDTTRDTGVALSGPLNAAGTVKYVVQFGNDSGNGSEADPYKALRLAAQYEATSGLSVEGVYGFFARDLNADWTLAQVFAGYHTPTARLGLQYSHQRRRAADGSAHPDTELDMLSGFGVFSIRPQQLSLFARVDWHADPLPDGPTIDYLPISPDAPFTLLLAGAEYYIHPAVRFSPNVEWVRYGTPPDRSVSRPGPDVVWRLTFYWVW